ncbi:hypothetical protein E2488_01955 [Gramella jeungdoensis]|uniref:DUF4432 family protein n=2 Tax=Flavobacteriaceae TaxID=49546 RepID=A0A4Y8AXG1_9FLAO|nr:hypothetical protein E2488_01955 [Gramella jeungdoensis]GGK51340.1 hypothetical protein GCM10007963_19620 [Lutibacter litoralis]
MTQILKNENLEIHVDLPNENYNFSRFDWTGKITEVKFQNISLSSVERTDCKNENFFGRGFYNEFGIDTALGFNDVEIGGWFHKIGVGLLKKDDNTYECTKKYEILPAEFKVINELNKILIICKSKNVNGYSYVLKKEIEVHENNFTIKYYLHNTGEKDIITDEYVHNFTAINKNLIGPNYLLKFPFKLKPTFFKKTVNLEEKVDIGQNEISFNGSPNEQFFFSNISGGESSNAAWELINKKNGIGISEIGSFRTHKVNLWGWKHVISPELFFNIFIKSKQSVAWTRTYTIFNVN